MRERLQGHAVCGRESESPCPCTGCRTLTAWSLGALTGAALDVVAVPDILLFPATSLSIINLRPLQSLERVCWPGISWQLMCFMFRRMQVLHSPQSSHSPFTAETGAAGLAPKKGASKGVQRKEWGLGDGVGMIRCGKGGSELEPRHRSQEWRN